MASDGRKTPPNLSIEESKHDSQTQEKTKMVTSLGRSFSREFFLQCTAIKPEVNEAIKQVQATEHTTKDQILALSEHNRRLLKSPEYLPHILPPVQVQKSSNPVIQPVAHHGLMFFTRLDQEQVEISAVSLSDDVNDRPGPPQPVTDMDSGSQQHQNPTPAVYPTTHQLKTPQRPVSSLRPPAHALKSSDHYDPHHIPQLQPLTYMYGSQNTSAAAHPSVGSPSLSELINRTQVLANVIGRLQRTTERNIRLEKCRERRLRSQVYQRQK